MTLTATTQCTFMVGELSSSELCADDISVPSLPLPGVWKLHTGLALKGAKKKDEVTLPAVCIPILFQGAGTSDYTRALVPVGTSSST